jgi:hypothetical protein
VFLGYPDDYKGWCLWDPCTKHIIILCSVIWNENKLPGTSTTPVPLLSVIQDEPDTEEVSPGKGSTELVGEDFSFTPVIPPVSLPSTLPPVKQETPEATPYQFFNLQSLTPAPSPIHPNQPPEPTSPMPTLSQALPIPNDLASLTRVLHHHPTGSMPLTTYRVKLRANAWSPTASHPCVAHPHCTLVC